MNEKAFRPNPPLDRDCFRDFVGGLRIVDIAARHGIANALAEERVRRGLYDFGFSAEVLSRVAGDASRRPPRARSATS